MPEKVLEIEINQKWCKKCGICITFCPTKVLGENQDKNIVVNDLPACIGCKLCELRCPDFAIEVIFAEPKND